METPHFLQNVGHWINVLLKIKIRFWNLSKFPGIGKVDGCLLSISFYSPGLLLTFHFPLSARNSQIPLTSPFSCATTNLLWNVLRLIVDP